MAENIREDQQAPSSESNTSDTAPLLQEHEQDLPPPPFNPSGK